MLSKVVVPQEPAKLSTLKKPNKVATVRQQPASCNKQTNSATAEPSQRFSSMTLPTGVMQPQVAALRYPFYRMQSPHVMRQNSVPTSPTCPNGQFPRFPDRISTHHLVHQSQNSMGVPYPATTIPANALSCIATPMTQRHARYLAKQTIPSEDTPKTSSSSSSSRDSGILSQDSSTSSQSFTNDDHSSSIYQQMNGCGFRTPQCVPKRSKQVAKKTVIEAPAVKFRGNAGGANSVLNRSRVSKSVNAGSRILSAATSATSSPATPRASWNSTSSAGGENETNNMGFRVERSTSTCTRNMEREKKNTPMHGKQDSFGSSPSVNPGKIPRPTNLTGERNSREDKGVTVMTKKIQQTLSVNEKSPRNSSLSGSDCQFSTSNPASHIPAPRAKTLSPPPQFASSKALSTCSSVNPMTPDSSSTSTCTLAANSRGSSSSLLTRGLSGACSNLDDTPTPSNRGSPEPNSVVKTTPNLVVEESDNLSVAVVPTSPRSPRLSPRVTVNSDDQTQGSLGYGPLSHIKLPYSTPILQRMQQTSNSGLNVSTNGGTYAKREKSSIYAASVGGQPIPEAFGSHVSLSSSSSVISPGTDTSAFEAAKLRRELELAHQKVAALTCQLSANTSVVQAFEQSLQSMNQRLRQLSASSALKEREVQELRKIIDRFRCQAVQNDWPSPMENARNGKKFSQSQEFVKSQHILDSDMVLHQAGSVSSLAHGSNIISGSGYCETSRYLQREPSGNEGRGFTSPSYMPIRDSYDRSNKKGSWLRSSIYRAFRRSKSRDPPDRPKVTSTSSSHDVNLPSPSSGSSVHHSPTSSSGESLSTTDKNVCSEEEGGEGMAGRELMLEMMHETVRSLQHQVRCLRAENAYLQRAIDRCSLANSAESSSDKASLTTSRGSNTAFSYHNIISNPLRTSRLHRELFAVAPEIGHQTVQVFLELDYKQISYRSGNDVQNIRRTATPPGPSQHYLQLPWQQSYQMNCPSGNGPDSEDLSHLHMIGRVCIDGSASDILAKIKNLFQIYLSYLDSDDHIGLSVDGIASVCVRMTPQSSNNGQTPKEVQLSPNNNETNPLKIDTGYKISRIKISLHDNAYALEKAVPPSLLNPLAVSSLAWISLIPATLLSKMIESLLTNKCVIIYGPRGSGKLEFGRILIDSMAKMFPGFWSAQPNAVHYYLRASAGAVNELRQVLMNALLSVEGLVIIRLPPALLSDLVNIMSELGFNTHPRKILLLAITDTLIFPEEPTKLPNCPGIFPFLADIQSASTYMHRCLRQRFSQFAFQCLDASNPVSNATELDALTEVIEWLPEFWLRCVTTSAWNSLSTSDDTSASTSAFILSPFRLLACPLTLQASSLWFREVCDSEAIFRRLGESNRDLMKWLATTWPWPSEKLPFVFAPFDRSSGLQVDPIMTASNVSVASASMIMYDSSASLPTLLSSNAENPTGTGPNVRKTSPCPILRRQ